MVDKRLVVLGVLIGADEIVDMGPVAGIPNVRLARYKDRYFRIDKDVLSATRQRLAGNSDCNPSPSSRLTNGVDRFLALVQGPVESKREVRAIADVDASRIARPLAHLAVPLVSQRRWFWISIVAAFLANLLILANFDQPVAVRSHLQHWVFIPIGLAMIAIVHELGHLAAAIAFGCKAHNIGVGFYRILPVFFADVSDIWRLRPGDRAIVDAAGIHLQLLVGLFIFAAYCMSTGDLAIYLRLLFFSNLFVVVLNLLPFGRLDGYWIASDLLNVTNLQKNSRAEFRNIILNSIQIKRSNSSAKDYLLAGYAALNFCFIAFVIGFFMFGITKLLMIAYREAFNFHSLSLLITHPLTLIFLIALAFRFFDWSARRQPKK